MLCHVEIFTMAWTMEHNTVTVVVRLTCLYIGVRIIKNCLLLFVKQALARFSFVQKEAGVGQYLDKNTV